MFYLEQWIQEIAERVLHRIAVERADIEEYQFIRLKETLGYAYERSSFYRELFQNSRVTPDDVHCPADLSKLPFTEPLHLSESPYRFLCTSQAAVARPHSFITSGTTGPQKKVFWTLGDIERIVEFMAAGIATVADSGDVVQILLADGRPYSQADLLYRGVRKMGAAAVISGTDATGFEQFRILEESRSTILFGYTGQIFRLTKELQDKTDLSKTTVNLLFLAGEYLPDAMRRELESVWNCEVRTHYGLTEMGLGVAVECQAHAGYHFNEAGLMVEIIDPFTGKAVAPGEEGELVFTSLMREAMPLIRYRTHDISRIIPGPCPCGSSTLLRIDAIRKRLESIVTLECGQLYPSILDDVLFEVPGLLDYRAELIDDSLGTRLKLNAEVLFPSPDTLQEIRRKLDSIPVIASLSEAEIVLAGPGSLQSIGRAKKLIRKTSCHELHETVKP